MKVSIIELTHSSPFSSGMRNIQIYLTFWEGFLMPALRPIVGALHIPKLTIRLQNPKCNSDLGLLHKPGTLSSFANDGNGQHALCR